MAGIWADDLVQELVVPSNAAPLPGSGAMYVGGPNLPYELKAAGYTAAIVWFTDTPSVPYLKYFFLARKSNPAFEDWNYGYVDTIPPPGPVPPGTGTIRFTEQHRYTFGVGSSHFVNGNEIVLDSSYMTISMRGSKPYIKAKPIVTTLDQWLTNTSTQTIAGVANCSVKVAWRQTPDYVVDARFVINVPGGGLPAIPGFDSFSLPVSFPTIDTDVTTVNQGPHYAGVYTVAGGQGSFNGRFESGLGYLFGTPAGVVIVEGSATFTVAKP